MEHSYAARQQCPRLEEQLAVGEMRTHVGAERHLLDKVSVLNLLHWGYRNVLIDSSSVTSHKKLYKGDCEFVRLDLRSFCNIVKAKLHAVTSGVTMPAGDAMLVRTTAAVGEADPTGNKMPITTEAQMNARYAIKMPDVMCQAVIDLTDRHGVGPEVLTQACSYCQEKGWRFTFITSYQYTFFVWRVAEDRYAVTDGLLHDAAPHDLYTREVLACPKFSKARFSRTKFSRARFSRTKFSRARLQDVPVAIKATDACKSPDIVQLLWHEAKIYEFLQDLQGHLLPVLHGCGYWSGSNNFFLATAVVPGKPINSCRGVADAQATAQAARQIIFIDFGHAYLHPTPEQCERELAELALALQELE
ncbi:hypothetical protein QJQ45_002959 [Haematococcus lacustris]|nr:hypothetical protein QJQ45_002959 [Haematococcus lacustris]